MRIIHISKRASKLYNVDYHILARVYNIPGFAVISDTFRDIYKVLEGYGE